MPRPPSPRRNASLVRSLQCFEAVARHQSMRLAAEELGVSQSAVSHQIRELTRVLGEQLLVRQGRGIAVSPTGQRLAERLADTFAGLQSSLDDIVGSARQVLRLAVCSSFGPGWLIPRLGDFLASHPEVDLQLLLYGEDPHLTHQVADAMVTALPLEAGYVATHIVDEMLVAVHRPARGARRYRLITTDIREPDLGLDWRNYCTHARLDRDSLQEGQWLQSSHYLLALEMAKAGLGVALVPDFLARRDIESGALAYFDRARMPSGRVYHLCCKELRAQEPALRALSGWLKSQLAADSVVQLTSRRSP